MSEVREGYRDYTKIVGMDPAANWLLGPGWEAFTAGVKDPVLQLIVASPDNLAGLSDEHAVDDHWPEFLLLGDLHHGDSVHGPISALTTRAYLDWLVDQTEETNFTKALKRIQLSVPLPAASVATIPGQRRIVEQQPPPLYASRDWPETTVVVGVIDDGIAFGHERFRHADGVSSRFEYFWNQDDGRMPPPLASVNYGREFGKAEIDALLSKANQPGIGVLEERLYREAGMADFRQPGHHAVTWRLAHGTHVLDLAAGYPSSLDRADRPLIGVQLPTRVTAATSGAALHAPVLHAVAYILSRAALLTPGKAPLPVVINFSYSTYLGPHNGTSLLEEGLDKAIGEDKGLVSIVLPAGNANMVPCHAMVQPGLNGTADLQVRVQPDSKAAAVVEIWLPVTPDGLLSSRAAIMVEAPDGHKTDWIEEKLNQGQSLPSNACMFPPSLVPSYAGIVYGYDPIAKQGHFRIDIGHTAWDQPGGSGNPALLKAPAGIWKITIKNRALPAGTQLHAWIERSDKLYGYKRRGRQAYFDATRCFDAHGSPETDDEASSGPVLHTGMENAVGTGRQPLVLGGYNRKDLTIADYSAGGPVLPASAGPAPAVADRPDALAVSDDSKVHRGVMAAGARSGSVLAMGGTSVAAPQVARLIADELAARKPVDHAALQARAIADDKGRPLPPPTLPAGRKGAGRLNTPSADRRPPRFWP